MKLIITAAITGGEPVHRGMTPYVPTTVDEITDEAVKCWEAGASIIPVSYTHLTLPTN